MFSTFTIVLATTGLAMLSAGGFAYALLYGQIERQVRVDRRIDRIQGRSPAIDVSRVRVDPTRRRKAIQDTLRGIEEKQKAKARNSSSPIALRIEQAGIGWSRSTFVVISVAIGIATFLVAWILGAPIYAALGFFVAGLLGLPRWLINFLGRRRLERFITEFPNAIDAVVRGVKAGLSLADCMKVIAAEVAEPVRSEFRKIVEAQALGIPLAEAVARLPDRVPVPEANFFAIVVAIQQKSGGNLAEALANLSRVLRERRKMKGRIKAMSMEAKASAVIIGFLPIIVIVLVYLTSSPYMSLLFTTPVGNVILVASALWMLIGTLVMRKMINFDF